MNTAFGHGTEFSRGSCIDCITLKKKKKENKKVPPEVVRWKLAAFSNQGFVKAQNLTLGDRHGELTSPFGY